MGTRHSPARPPVWPEWAARQPRKTRNFERVLRALPLISPPYIHSSHPKPYMKNDQRKKIYNPVLTVFR
jgi:hypothetical protein